MMLLRLLFVAASPLVRAGGNVENTSVGFTPLDELGTGTYLGSQGGLYPAGLNAMPAAHRAAGTAKAAMIQRLDNSGNPSPSGKIVILTLGMSNANQVFSKLGELMNGLWAPGVVLVNGAQGGIDAALWANPSHAAWDKAEDFLTAAGASSAVVLAKLLAPAGGSSLANDSFESGDFLGGGGWTMSNWLVSGPATVVSSTASDGVWSAQVDANASIARSSPLLETAGAVLEFDWRSALPPGAVFTVEIHNGSWKPVFTRNAVNQATWVSESVPLDAYEGASTFGVRFRTTGSGAFAGVDKISLVKSANPSGVPPMSSSLQMLAGERMLLR